MEIQLVAEKITQIGPLPITNTLLVTWMASLLLIIVATLVGRNIQTIPGGLQNMLEMIIEYIYQLSEELAQLKVKRRHTHIR